MPSAQDGEICAHCGEEWTMDQEDNPQDNNELVYCSGSCGKLWHQRCYNPSLYPIPEGEWFCRDCEGQEPSSSLPAKTKGKKRTKKPISVVNLVARRDRREGLRDSVVPNMSQVALERGQNPSGRIADQRSSRVAGQAFDRLSGRDSADMWDCDGCGKVCRSIHYRFRCETCPDFDLCASCYRDPAINVHEHALVRVDRRAAASSSGLGDGTLVVGSLVQGRHPGGTGWYNATIVEVRSDSFVLDWQDGDDTYREQPKNRVRPRKRTT